MPSAKNYEDRPAPHRPHRRRTGQRILLTALALLIALAVGFFGHMYYEAHRSSIPPAVQAALDSAAELVAVGSDSAVSIGHVEEILKPASDLITTRFYYTDADLFEDYKQALGRRLPFTTNRTVFTYDGVVGLGFDFSEIGIEIDKDSRVITLTLPKAQIVSNEIDADSFQYFDVSSSVFNQTEMGDITELIAVLKEKTAERVMEDPELLAQAENNAEQILLGFLRASDLTQNFTVTFVHA